MLIFKFIFFGFFFFCISTSLLTLPICSCVLFAFSIRTFHLLIIIILNYLANKSNIDTIFEDGSDTRFISADNVLFFLIEWFILLVKRHDVLCSRRCKQFYGVRLCLPGQELTHVQHLLQQQVPKVSIFPVVLVLSVLFEGLWGFPKNSFLNGVCVLKLFHS